jgi:tyramine---L-glutamate ligase
MRDALVADLATGASAELLTLESGAGDRLPPAGCVTRWRDQRHSEREDFEQAARWADLTVIIAPEFAGILAARHDWAKAAGARVVGCSRQLIDLASDKHRTAQHLAQRGVKVPCGQLLAGGEPLPRDFSYPAVLKPVDGAGSLDVRLLEGPDDLAAVPPAGQAWRLERFCPGMAASVALLCGPGGARALPACRQLLGSVHAASVHAGSVHAGSVHAGSADSADIQIAPFTYCGGQLPLMPALDTRAQRLAEEAVATLEEACGWLGIDLVLGNDPDGADDVVVEINPRLTTSYLGLRRLACGNLASGLLAVAQGQPAELSFRSEPLQFAPDGCITQLEIEN